MICRSDVVSLRRDALRRRLAVSIVAGIGLGIGGVAYATTVTIAVPNNNDLIEMKKLSPVFEKANPDIQLKWIVLEENVLRQRLTTDITTNGGQFDVAAIGTYEAPLWGKRGWLVPVTGLPASYDLERCAQIGSRRAVVPWDAIRLAVQRRKLDDLLLQGFIRGGFNENLSLMTSGKCAIWVDATSAAGILYNKTESSVADKVGFAAAPTQLTPKGAHWLWSWSFAVPKSSNSQDAAKRFIEWSTSKEYITLVGNDIGWASLPPGTRQSTYARPEYKQAAPFSEFVLNAIDTANPNDSTLKKVPYSGVQYVGIPEFQSFGTLIGQQIAGALAGQMTVDQALLAGQAAADRAVRQAGYPK